MKSKVIALVLLMSCLGGGTARAEGAEDPAPTTQSHAEGPKDMNLFSVEPTVLDERYFQPAVDTGSTTEDQSIRNMLKTRAGLD